MIKRSFAFFNEKISSKYGEKCCRYGLNGKPFSKTRVDAFFSNIKDLIDGWRVDEQYSMLYRYFYTEDYLAGLNMIKLIAEIDGGSTQNLPNFHFTNGNLLKVELTSHPLKGISHIDFELAIRLNRLNFDELMVTPIDDPNNYRMELRLKKQEKDSQQLQEELKKSFAVDR